MVLCFMTRACWHFSHVSQEEVILFFLVDMWVETSVGSVSAQELQAALKVTVRTALCNKICGICRSLVIYCYKFHIIVLDVRWLLVIYKYLYLVVRIYLALLAVVWRTSDELDYKNLHCVKAFHWCLWLSCIEQTWLFNIRPWMKAFLWDYFYSEMSYEPMNELFSSAMLFWQN